MTEAMYRDIQERFSKKLIGNKSGLCTNKEAAYNDGVLACKSILKEIYNRELMKQQLKMQTKEGTY